jgi:hypothetical protein
MSEHRREYRAFIADFERSDDGSMVVIISNGSVDRFNTILDPAGWDLRSYKANPVVMWAHQREQLPIAKCKRVWIEGDKLKAEVDWSDSVKLNPFAAQVKAYYDAGLLRGWSVGFIPHETEYPDATTVSIGHDAKAKPTTFRKMELVEFSAAPIPANPGTLSENALLSRSIGEATGVDSKFLEILGASIPEGSRKSALVPEFIAGAYERKINEDLKDRAKAKGKPTKEQCADDNWLADHPEAERDCMNRDYGDSPCCGDVDERDFEDLVEDRIDWTKIGSGHRKREEIPDHVFLKAGKKYPYKQKKGGQWVVSCKDLRDAISQSNAQKDTAVSKKAQSIYAKNCAKKSWDGEAAFDRTWTWSKHDLTQFQKTCAMPLERISLDVWPLVHHDVNDEGSLVTSYLGVREALASLLTMDAEVRSTEPARTAYVHLTKHWSQFGMPTPDIGLEDERDMDDRQREAARDLLERGDVEGALVFLDRAKRDGYKDPDMEDTPAGGYPFKHRHGRKLRAGMRAMRRAHRYVRMAMDELRQNEDPTKKEPDPNAPPYGGPTTKTVRTVVAFLREVGVVGEKGEAALLQRVSKLEEEEDKYADQGGKTPMKEKKRDGSHVGDPHPGEEDEPSHPDQPKAKFKGKGKFGPDGGTDGKSKNRAGDKPDWDHEHAEDMDDDPEEAKLKKALTEAGMDAEAIERAVEAWRKLPKAQKAARKEPVDGDQKHGNVLPGQEDDEYNEEADENDPGDKGPHGRKVVNIEDDKPDQEEAWDNAGDKDPDQKRKRKVRKRDQEAGSVEEGEDGDETMDEHDPGKKGPHGRFVDLLKDLGLDDSEIEKVLDAARGIRRQRVETQGAQNERKRKRDVGQGGPDADDDDPKGGKAPGPARKRVEKSLKDAGLDDESVRKVLESWDRNQDTGGVAAGEEDDEMMQDHDPTPEPHKTGAGKHKQDEVIKMADGVELRGDDVIEFEVGDGVEDR